MAARVKDEVLEKELARVGDLKVLLMHGKRDRAVPFTAAKKSEAVLKAAGLDVELRSYDCGHHVTIEQVTYVKKWLKSVFGLR